VEADVEDAEARMTMSDLSIPDYGNILNGLFHFAPPAPGKVSFDLRWFGAKKRGSFSDASLPFQIDYVQTGAHLSWSGTTGGDSFHTTDGQQKVNFAQIANERNGSFFDQEDDGSHEGMK
jgi:hypothetical protein